MTDSYEYDNNGNMTCRYERGTLYKHHYNAENRPEEIEEYDSSDTKIPGFSKETGDFNCSIK